MSRQGGQVQLQQSDMSLALNMAKMAKGGFSCAMIEETQYLIKNLTPKSKKRRIRELSFLGMSV